MEAVGLTSTIPVEIIYAAGCKPVDLNNAFINDPQPQKMLDDAERRGIPRNTCSWVKGIYSAILKHKVHTVVGVVQGDCTHVVTMLETLLPKGVEFVPFAYPYEKASANLRQEIQKLMNYFGVGWDQVNETHEKLNKIREMAHLIDRMTWKDNTVGSADNFEALINCTDFMGEPSVLLEKLKTILNNAGKKRYDTTLKLGMIGVPGVFTDLYEYLEEKNTDVVYHEVARQFAMPNYLKGLLDQYLTYTYPYSVYERLSDIKSQSELRQLDGYIHYVQSFCHHQLEDAVFKKQLHLPVLTLEGDRVGAIDGRSRTRIDAFLEMLTRKKRVG